MGGMRGLVLTTILAGACYRPASTPSCTAACDFASLGSAAPCPDGLVCATGGVCANPDGTCGSPGSDGSVPDADAVPDAPNCAGILIGQDMLKVCLKMQPTMSQTLSAMNIV